MIARIAQKNSELFEWYFKLYMEATSAYRKVYLDVNKSIPTSNP